MPRDGDRRLRLRFEHTRYGHWGGRSGYPRLVEYFDPELIIVQRHGAADSDDEISPWLRPLKPALRAMLRRRPMQWYKVSDLSAEFCALGECLAGRVDLLHFLDGEHSGQFLPRLLRRAGSRVKTVASFHQPPDLLERLVDPALLAHFDRIVLMSPSQRPYFEGRVADHTLSVILHGVDTDFFHPSEGKQPTGALRCVTAGHWLRDWRLFRSVAERLPEVEFHVVTSHETGAADLANVFHHQGVDDPTLAELYRSADILFLPLINTTANNALLEGLASGLPVVTTELESTHAYLNGDERFLTPSGDAEACAAAIRRLQADPILRSRMGQAARRRAEELSWPRIAEQYTALYKGLLS
ncbi:MAG: glycosyltransferase family 4 protein [Acetobacteraceae bacterium]|nr:glycosyltransferase family 4 protein [Acetobacteraceae bacterium]